MSFKALEFCIDKMDTFFRRRALQDESEKSTTALKELTIFWGDEFVTKFVRTKKSLDILESEALVLTAWILQRHSSQDGVSMKQTIGMLQNQAKLEEVSKIV